MYFIVLYCTAFYFLYCIVFYSTVLYCIILYFTGCYCVLLYFTVFQCIVLQHFDWIEIGSVGEQGNKSYEANAILEAAGGNSVSGKCNVLCGE